MGIYYEDRVGDFQDETQKRRFISRIKRLTVYFGKHMLGDVSTKLTQGYEKKRGNSGGARRDLEDLRAAINHHASENLHHGVVKVKLPEKGKARDRWLERSEAARLLWAAWRHKEVQTIHRGKNKGIKIKTGKYTLRHVARFILIGLYTGTRASAIAAASPRKKEVMLTSISTAASITVWRSAGALRTSVSPPCRCRTVCWSTCGAGTTRKSSPTTSSSGRALASSR